MPIEDIELGHFSATKHLETASAPESLTRHSVFHSFLYDNIKQYSATTATHRECIIVLFKLRDIISSKLSTLWENTDVCVESYRCTTELLFLSILSQYFYIILYHGFSAPGNGI